ncbi:MAG: FtsQ-type POTRA domain-containing protein [Chloroflexota bacterium]
MSIAGSKSRSDALRERRRKQGHNKIAPERKNRVTAQRNAAPTVVRTRSMAVAPTSGKRNQQARRRNYLSLGNTGAEFRLPSLPTVKIGWRLVSGPLAALLTFAIYTLFNSPNMKVNLVEVVGLERISQAEINAVLGVYGSAIFSLTPSSLEQNLRAAFPELTDVAVNITFPASVVIEAGERRPVISWEQEDFSAWVDQNGVAFRDRGSVDGLVRVIASHTPVLPETTTPVQDQIITPKMVQAILTLSLQAPAGTDILYSPEHGLGWQDPLGWQVFFGNNPDDMETRLTIYAEIVAELTKRGLHPVMISLEFLHAPYYRLVSAK